MCFECDHMRPGFACFFVCVSATDIGHPSNLFIGCQLQMHKENFTLMQNLLYFYESVSNKYIVILIYRSSFFFQRLAFVQHDMIGKITIMSNQCTNKGIISILIDQNNEDNSLQLYKCNSLHNIYCQRPTFKSIRSNVP